MRHLILTILLVFTSTFAHASALTHAQVVQNLRAAIEENPSFNDIPADLTFSPSFTALWQKPEKLVVHARSLLLNPRLNADDKLVLVLALQNVRWPELFKLYEWAFDAYAKGQISAKIVDALIFPSNDWNTRLQLNYNDQSVQRLLVRIQASKLPQEQNWLKKYIPDILSGKAAAGINIAQQSGQLLQRNRTD